MALLLKTTDSVIKVISSKDASVQCSEDAYAEYLKNLDESLLELEEGAEPTRFVLKASLSYKEHTAVKNAQINMEKGKVGVSLKFMMEEIRQALVDIEEPDSVPVNQRIGFTKNADGKKNSKEHPDGKISYETIAMLESAGVLTELYSARASEASSEEQGLVKKKLKLS